MGFKVCDKAIQNVWLRVYGKGVCVKYLLIFQFHLPLILFHRRSSWSSASPCPVFWLAPSYR